jgi:hypothetical protein
MSAPDRCPPPLVLEAALVKDLSSEQKELWGQHLSSCERCTGALEEMARVGAEFERDLAPSIRDGLEAKRSLRSRVQILSGAGSLLLAASLVLAVLKPPPRGPDLEPKGRGILSLALEDAQGVHRWDGRSAFPNGRRIQLLWSSDTPVFVAVVLVERTGEKTVLFPEGGSNAARVEPGHDRRLGDSVIASPALEGAKLRVYERPREFALSPMPEEFESELELPPALQGAP